MKSLVVAIERDRDQAARLENVVRTRVGADLVLAGSTSEALAALGDRVPDLILAPPLLPARDEAAVADRLRQLGPMAAHVQTITVPRLGSGSAPRARKEGGFFNRLRRAETAIETTSGCDPEVFAQQLTDYLHRAQTDRAAAAESLASAAAGREVNHRTAEVPVPASSLLTVVPAQHETDVTVAQPSIEEPYEPLTFDPLLEILRPHRGPQQAPWPGNEPAAPAELLAPAAQSAMVEATEAVAPAALDAIEDVFDADSLFASDIVLPVVADETSAGRAASAGSDEPSRAQEAAEPLVAVAAASYEQEPQPPVFPVVDAVSRRDEPPGPQEAAEPLVAVAAASYEQEPQPPVFPVVDAVSRRDEPSGPQEAAEPLVAVAAASYEQEPIAPLFPAAPLVAFHPLPEPAAQAPVAVVAEPHEHAEFVAAGMDAFAPEPHATGEATHHFDTAAVPDGAGDEAFDALALLGEPDEEIASALAAAASLTDSLARLTPDTPGPIAAPMGAAASDGEPIELAAEEELPVVEEPAVGETSTPAPVDEAQTLTLPAIDLSELELEFLVDDEAQQVVAEPAVPVTPEPETPFVIAATDFDDLEISEFLEALVTTDPEPPQPVRAPRRPAAAQKTKPQAVPAKAAAAPAETRQPAAKTKAATRAASKKRRARVAAQPAPAKPHAAAARAAAATRPQAPIQDEWGVYDPDQCGFAALVAKLDDVIDEEPPSKRAGSSTRVISYS